MQKRKGDSVEAYPEAFPYSKKIMEGLKAVHVVVSAGAAVGAPQGAARP